MIRLLKRCTETAIKLPFAMEWDVISLGNMGDGASTQKVLREHEAKKQADDFVEAVKLLKELSK